MLYRRLGFFLTEPSHHTLGSVNRTAVFARDYLELIGIDRTAPSPRLELLRTPLGLEGLVFRAADADRVYEALRQRGIEAAPPIAFSRPAMLPEGPAEARFRVVRLANIPFGRCYFCEHLTPDLVWRDEFRHHPNGAIAISRIVFAAADPAALQGFFRRLFGEEPATIEIVPLAEAGSPRDAISGLDFRVRSLEDARRALAAGGIQARETARRIEVPAEAGFGAPICFVAD